MRRFCSIFFIIIILLTGNLHGTPQQGGRGLIYLHSALLIPKGFIQFYGGLRYFGKVAQFGWNERAYTLWHVQGFTTFNIGLSSHFELAVSPIIFQDTNRGDGWSKEAVNFPDDILVSVKMGSMRAMESPFVFGGMLYGRIPTARTHNIIYEPYSAGSVELGITGLVSYFHNPSFPDADWSLHGNLGYLNHNDVGQEITGDPAHLPTEMSNELLIGLGFRYPAGTFDFSAEINSRFFLQRPPVSAYSMEDVTYLTAGVYYKPYRWITFEMGIDVRLSSDEDLTNYDVTPTPKPAADFPNYPSWRSVLGVKLAILPMDLYSSSDEELLRQRADDRKEVLERMMQGEQKTENAGDELTRIRAERERIEEELKRLRKLLEAEKKKKEGKEKK